LPERWLEKKASLNPDLPLNFVSTNETLGGSSGSPVFDKELEIVGVIFDGNTQSLVGHFVYDGTQSRAISVDTRGIMETLLKVYDASGIVNELTNK
jgi:Peptidase S46